MFCSFIYPKRRQPGNSNETDTKSWLFMSVGVVTNPFQIIWHISLITSFFQYSRCYLSLSNQSEALLESIIRSLNWLSHSNSNSGVLLLSSSLPGAVRLLGPALHSNVFFVVVWANELQNCCRDLEVFIFATSFRSRFYFSTVNFRNLLRKIELNH